MEDIRTVLSQFHSKKNQSTEDKKTFPAHVPEKPQFSEIPDLFFDAILRDMKLSRSEITVFIYLYRQIWCRPSPYKAHGIGPLNSYLDLSSKTGLSSDEVVTTLKSLEKYGLIETVRVGQYFIRKYFTHDYDQLYGQTYEF